MTQDENNDAGSPTREIKQPDHTVMIEVPRELGCYRLSKLLGRGGMGEVWQALDTQLEREVAIKLMRKELSENADAARRFAREARAVARLNHPNIVQVYAFGDERGINYFVMELVEGETVSQCLKRKAKLPLEDAVSIILQSIEGLGYACARGIIHRDIKPSNLMLTEDGRVKIADFGLAKMIEHDTQMTAAGTAMGSPNYMSPEQARGEEADHRSDIYALGVSLFQMLCGDLPFTANSPVAVLLKQIQDPLPEHDSIKCINNGAALAVLKKMTEKRPEARYQNYAELAAALSLLVPENRVRSAYLPTGTMPAAAEDGDTESDRTKTQSLQVEKSTLVGNEEDSSPPLVPPVPPMKTHPKLARPVIPGVVPEAINPFKKSSVSRTLIMASGVIALLAIGTVAWLTLGPTSDNESIKTSGSSQEVSKTSIDSKLPQTPLSSGSTTANSSQPATPTSAPVRAPSLVNSNNPMTITAVVTPVATAAPGAASGFTPTPSTSSLMPKSLEPAPTPAVNLRQTAILGIEGAPLNSAIPLYLDEEARRLYKQMPAGTEVTLIRNGPDMLMVLPANETRPVYVHKKMARVNR